MIFKRKIYDELLLWKKDNGKTAVLIQGARRVGKSTIVEEFASKEYETYILVDFAVCSTEVRELFDDLSDLNRIFIRLQLEYGSKNVGQPLSLMKSSLHQRQGRRLSIL